MANEKLHLVHVKSSVKDRVPTASTLNYGEIAVNYNVDSPALYIKDSTDKIVKFGPERGNAKIFYGECSSPASATTKTVVCTAFTSEDLVEGAIVYVKFTNTSTAVVSSTTLDVNSTGAYNVKKIKNGSGLSNLDYAAELTAHMTQAFTFTGSYWAILGVDKDTDTTYTQSKLRRETGGYIADSKVYRYQMLFQMMDEQRVTPLNNNSNATGNSKTMLTNVEFNPFGYIYYYGSTTSANTNTTISAAYFYYTHGSNINLRYTFNSVSLTTNKSVYLEVIPQSNGSVKLASSTPLTQTLPTAETSNWFILLGMATSSYQLNLYPGHPVYTHNGTEIVELLNPEIMAGLKNSVVTIDSELDTGSTNPLANSAITTYIYDIEKVASAALNDLEDRKADKSYVDEAVSSITIDVDSELDSGSTNPVANSAITKVISEDEKVISAAFNDLETRKADKSYVDTAVSSITIDVDSSLSSSSTNPVENQVIWSAMTEMEFVTTTALNDINDRVEELEDGLTTQIGPTSTDSEYPSAKAVYDEIHPAIRTSRPSSGGFLPNVEYYIGTVTGNVTFSLASPVSGIANHYFWTFETSSTAPTITWPSQITKWVGNCLDSASLPVLSPNKSYEISVLDGKGVLIEF